MDTDHHPVGKYYEQIYKALQHIHTSEGSKASVDFLIELTKKGYIYSLHVPHAKFKH